MQTRGLRSRSRGFSLVEVIVAVALLTVAALMLMAALSSSNQMSSLARERTAANNAVRAYIERMRQLYPPQSETKLTGFLTDTACPADAAFLSSVSIEKSVLKNVECLVLKTVHENPTAGSTAWSQAVTFGGATATNIGADDIAAFGLPRDINGDGDTTDGEVAADSAALVLFKVELRWTSGSDTKITATTKKQRLTVYAMLSPQH